MQDREVITSEGFTIIENVYSPREVDALISLIEKATENPTGKSTFRQSGDLFAIRQFHKEIPEVLKHIFNKNLIAIIEGAFGNDYFITKSIYFDKPEKSNWFVSYHQDLTISVDRRIEMKNFENWTTKQGQFAVQPPLEILENNFTIRIHLDNTTLENGALKVINKSHRKGIRRIEDLRTNELETICEVGKGGVMIMKPLLFHASSKTTNNERRRVVHMEFSNQELPNGLKWSERIDYYHKP